MAGSSQHHIRQYLSEARRGCLAPSAPGVFAPNVEGSHRSWEPTLRSGILSLQAGGGESLLCDHAEISSSELLRCPVFSMTNVTARFNSLVNIEQIGLIRTGYYSVNSHLHE